MEHQGALWIVWHAQEIYDALPWIGNAFLIAGLWGVGNRHRTAFVLSFAGEIPWVAYGYLGGNWAITSISVVYSVVLIRNWMKWRKDESLCSSAVD